MRKSIEYFTDKELACKKTGKLILDSVFDVKLFELRKKLNLPMHVNSCCRSREYNKQVGGRPKSFHIFDDPQWIGMEGCGAIDIGYSDITYRNALARLAWELGWRIGYNKHFLHLDIAAIKKILPQSIFKYDNITPQELQEFSRQITVK